MLGSQDVTGQWILVIQNLPARVKGGEIMSGLGHLPPKHHVFGKCVGKPRHHEGCGK